MPLDRPACTQKLPLPCLNYQIESLVTVKVSLSLKHSHLFYNISNMLYHLIKPVHHLSWQTIMNFNCLHPQGAWFSLRGLTQTLTLPGTAQTQASMPALASFAISWPHSHWQLPLCRDSSLPLCMESTGLFLHVLFLLQSLETCQIFKNLGTERQVSLPSPKVNLIIFDY